LSARARFEKRHPQFLGRILVDRKRTGFQTISVLDEKKTPPTSETRIVSEMSTVLKRARLQHRKELVELRNGQKARIQNQRYISERRIRGYQSSAIETH
jgi:hypothetical protein